MSIRRHVVIAGPLSRPGVVRIAIRVLVCQLFVFVPKIVDRVYSIWLALCVSV